MNYWLGHIAFTDVPTLDGRVLKAGALRRVKVPRQLVTRIGGVIVVGTVDVAREAAEGIVIGAGVTDLPPGRYAVGVDLDIDQAAITVSPDSDLLTITDATLIGLTVYAEDGPIPAWPDAHIIVSGS